MKNMKKIAFIVLSALLLFVTSGCLVCTDEVPDEIAVSDCVKGVTDISDEDVSIPDILTFRAKVLRRNLRPAPAPWSQGRPFELLFVKSVTPVFDWEIGGTYSITSYREDGLADIFSAEGEPISHLDIPIGAIVEIEFSIVFPFGIPIIPPITIRVVE